MENKMKKITGEIFEGERALYASQGLDIYDTVFKNGESHLKESSDIKLEGCIFEWKYPLWNCDKIEVKDTTLLQSARSGIWYTDGISMTGCTIDAPKTFRRSSNITLVNCTMPYAQESLWSCSDIKISSLCATGDYFGKCAESIRADGLMLSGNYAFDGAKNIEISSSRLISKDAFWNCENVTVRDSVIIGEYLAWNSKNITFINCTIESNQGLCYIDGLKLVDCKLINTDLCFEYCKNIEASVIGNIISVKNPTSGYIQADSIGEIILDNNFCNPNDTVIKTKN